MANYKTTIGIFTLGGILLFLAGIFFLGGQKLFSSQAEYVLYFERSVSGLSVGAPVVFRGVPLGNVSRISLVFDPRSSSVTIPVYIRIDENAIVRRTGKEIPEIYQHDIIRYMVQNGLGARLQIQSLVTGQYRIELDYYKNVEMKFHSSKPNNEIPTAPSPIDELQQNLAKLPLEQMSKSLNSILLSLANALGDGEELKAGIASFHKAFAESENLFKTTATLRASLESLLSKLDLSAGTVSKELPGILTNLRTTLEELSATVSRFKNVSTFAQTMFNQNSPAMQDTRRLLKEAADAARSLHNLADLLNRNPEALLQGKRGGR
ncbi:MAG: MCE family protein [Desulfovibrionaceae bacterium]|nr:MCE family protein [Desulfovibrionaceae bacterium]